MATPSKQDQAVEEAYRRGKRDAARSLREVVGRHDKHPYNTDVPELELTDLIADLEGGRRLANEAPSDEMLAHAAAALYVSACDARKALKDPATLAEERWRLEKRNEAAAEVAKWLESLLREPPSPATCCPAPTGETDSPEHPFNKCAPGCTSRSLICWNPALGIHRCLQCGAFFED